MPITKEIRIVTLFVECEKEFGPVGIAIAERASKTEHINNAIVISESLLTEYLDLEYIGGAVGRLAQRQYAESRFGNPTMYPHADCVHKCQHALRGGCPVVCGKAMAKG